MLPTAEFVENGMPADAFSRLAEIELSEPDYNKWVDLAWAGRAVASLSHVTAGETDRPYFSSSEVRLVGSLTSLISDGLRRSLVLDDAWANRRDTGMLVLNPDDGVDLANQVAARWMDELGLSTRAGTKLPLVIRAVARQARAIGLREERHDDASASLGSS